MKRKSTWCRLSYARSTKYLILVILVVENQKKNIIRHDCKVKKSNLLNHEGQ